jgi:hypothetical protein
VGAPNPTHSILSEIPQAKLRRRLKRVGPTTPSDHTKEGYAKNLASSDTVE